VSRKHSREHRHGQAKKNHPSGIQGNLPSSTSAIDTDTPSCADVHESSKENEEPTQMPKKPDWMTIFTAILALFAVLSFIALWIQLEDARDNFARDQQPIIWVTPKTPTFSVNQMLEWNIEYSNYGRSPALNFRTCIRATLGSEALNRAKMPTGADCANARTSVSVVPPTYPGFATATSDGVLTQADVNAIEQFSGGLVVLGHFEYDDASGHSYVSSFCEYRLKSGALAHCPKYNDYKRTKLISPPCHGTSCLACNGVQCQMHNHPYNLRGICSCEVRFLYLL
jgi:hypothetical protein